MQRFVFVHGMIKDIVVNCTSKANWVTLPARTHSTRPDSTHVQTNCIYTRRRHETNNLVLHHNLDFMKRNRENHSPNCSSSLYHHWKFVSFFIMHSRAREYVTLARRWGGDLLFRYTRSLQKKKGTKWHCATMPETHKSGKKNCIFDVVAFHCILNLFFSAVVRSPIQWVLCSFFFLSSLLQPPSSVVQARQAAAAEP